MIGAPKMAWCEAVRRPGSREREIFLGEYAPLVRFVAARLAARLPREASLDDLIGDGLLGLMEAVRRFEPEKGVQFATFAESRIRGAMLDGLRQRDFFPRSLRRRQKEMEEAVSDLTGELGRPPDDEELGARLGIDAAALRIRLDEARGVALLPMEADSENGRVLHAAADAAAQPDQPLQKKEAGRLLKESLKTLPERDRLVLSFYYMEGMTLKEIGAVLDVTESRICQIHTRAVLALRGMLRKAMSAPQTAAVAGRESR
ncbi:MAG: FliA/WhiG family RNA polymerase sigma factor [Acidobacteriota bacterium]